MKSNKTARAVLFLVTTTFWFSLYAYTPFINPDLMIMGVSASLMGIIGGAYGFTQMLLRIPVGIGSDKWQKKLFIIIGCVAAVLAALTMMLFHNPIGFLIGRALGGVAAASWVPFTVLYASYYDGEHATRAITMVNLASQLGRFFSFLLASFAAAYFGTQGAFVLALLVGLIGLALSFGIKEHSTPSSRGAQAPSQALRKPPLSTRELLAVGANPRVLLCSLLAVVVQVIAFATQNTFTQNHAVELGATTAQLGYSQLALLSVSILLSLLLGKHLLQFIDARLLVVIGFAITAIYCFVVPVTTSILQLYLAQVLGGIGNTLTFTLLMGLCVQDVTKPKRGAAMGFFQSIYGLGMTIGPMMMGVIIDATSLTAGFYTMAGLALATTLLALFLFKKPRTKH
jgi:MFS family permease